MFKLTPLNIPEMKKKLFLNLKTDSVSQNNDGNNGLWVWYLGHYKTLSMKHYIPLPYYQSLSQFTICHLIVEG